MHAISSYRGNRPTDTHTQTPTHRQDGLQYTAPQLAHSVMTITDGFCVYGQVSGLLQQRLGLNNVTQWYSNQIYFEYM